METMKSVVSMVQDAISMIGTKPKTERGSSPWHQTRRREDLPRLRPQHLPEGGQEPGHRLAHQEGNQVPQGRLRRLGGGTQRRAFLYIDDFLDGLFRLDEYVETKGNLTVNLGSTEETTIKALAERIIDISGKRITPKYDTTKPVGVLRRLPDLTRAEKVLGWRPKTQLADGLAKTYEWAERSIASWS